MRKIEIDAQQVSVLLVLSSILCGPSAYAADLDPELSRQLYEQWRIERQTRTRRAWPSDIESELARRGPPESPAIKRGDRLPLTSSAPEGSENGLTVKPRDARPLVTAPT